MLNTVAVVFFVVWLLGLLSSHTVGGFIHILLAISIVFVLVAFMSRAIAFADDTSFEETPFPGSKQ